MNKFYSQSALLFAFCVLTFASFVFYPKWKKPQTEAELSWDVAGYYFYLPAFFIYKDPLKVGFKDDIQKKYNPQTVYYSTALYPPTGNQVMKYASGMAIMYAPAFFVAHLSANFLSFPADGFSLPYQFAIQLWSLLLAFVGLYYLRKVLLKLNFSDKAVAITLVLYILATNYLDYASITNAMSHSYIFTLYALLLWCILKFYENGANENVEINFQNPKSKIFIPAVGIGTTIGLAVLARPSELPIILLPVLWGIGSLEDVKQRLLFLKENIFSVAMAVITFAAWISIQLIYWKAVTGKFLYNSYGEGEKFFDWKRPHIIDGLFSAQKGWFVYTPIMIFAMFGLVLLYKKQRGIFFPITIYLAAFIYVSFAYKIWWYAGSLGQRQMVQTYSILAIPFAAFVQWLLDFRLWTIDFGQWTTNVNKNPNLNFQNLESNVQRPMSKILFPILTTLFIGACIYMNLFWTYNAHIGGNFDGENMTRAYFWRVLGKTEHDRDDDKLLDNKYDVKGERKNIEVFYTNNFEADTSAYLSTDSVINGKKSLFLDKTHQVTEYRLPLFDKNKTWLRAVATFYIREKEYDIWKMSKFQIIFKKNKQVVRVNEIRLQRLMNAFETRQISLDAKIPKIDFDSVFIGFDNNGGNKKIWLDDLSVETFD